MIFLSQCGNRHENDAENGAQNAFHRIFSKVKYLMQSGTLPPDCCLEMG
jgi:hypothetical protein